jgi:hypothetical protein
MIGGLAYLIGLSSQSLANQGSAISWSLPLLGADLVAFSGLFMVWRSAQAKLFSSANPFQGGPT